MAVAILAFLGVAACTPTKPPLDQLDAASRALGTARDAGAAELAGPTYRAAAQRFDAAQAAEGRGEYALAADLAAESQVSSELAAAQARLARLRGEVDRMRRENAATAGDLRQAPGMEFQQ
ncbi:MAG: DUF4398 domain-containing protein [Xanthomonadales bacterium]|nr:DUF4398 domain-containing protein [Xanthomonadales bacterium]